MMQIFYLTLFCGTIETVQLLFLCTSQRTLLSDTCLLTSELAQVVQFRTANLTTLVHLNAVDVRRLNRENTLNANRSRHLANGETSLLAMTANLDNNTAVQLNTLL